MASFELRSTNCDGHIRALQKAILMASKIAREALLEFKDDKMRLCAGTGHIFIKFVFEKNFFSDYNCDEKRRYYINLKALLMPFKSSILASERDGGLRSQIRIKCLVEDQIRNQIVFKIGPDTSSATLTYRLSINDLDPDRKDQLKAINRTFERKQVMMAPLPAKRERFLLSAFTSFAPDLDQVTIKVSQSEVKFIGSVSPQSRTPNNKETKSEFTHKREDFCNYDVKENLNVTIQLKSLKSFLTFVETNKMQTFSTYVLEGLGLPIHFIYETNFYKGHFVSATSYEYIDPELDREPILPIEMGPNESFIADENVIHEDVREIYEDDETENYDDDESDTSEFLDGNLEGLNQNNNSIVGGESIRSRIGEGASTYDNIVDWDKDPDEIEGVKVCYSSDECDEN